MSNRSKKVTDSKQIVINSEIVNYEELVNFNPTVDFTVDENIKEFKSVSAQIRYLYDSGMKQSLIAKELKVRDQMVSNIVRKYKSTK